MGVTRRAGQQSWWAPPPPDGGDLVQCCEVRGGSDGPLPLPAQATEASGLGGFWRSSAARRMSPRPTRSHSRMTRRRVGRSSGVQWAAQQLWNQPVQTSWARGEMPGGGDGRSCCQPPSGEGCHSPRDGVLRRFRSALGAGPRPAISQHSSGDGCITRPVHTASDPGQGSGWPKPTQNGPSPMGAGGRRRRAAGGSLKGCVWPERVEEQEGPPTPTHPHGQPAAGSVIPQASADRHAAARQAEVGTMPQWMPGGL